MGRRMDRWSERRQKVLDEGGQIHRDDPHWSKRNAETPGPQWAYAINAIPFVAFIGEIAIGVDFWRRRRRRGGS